MICEFYQNRTIPNDEGPTPQRELGLQFQAFTESELQPSEMTRHTWLYTRMLKVRLDIDKIIDSESVLTVVIMTGSSESSRRALMRPE
jgi:hypothetical protein